MVDANARSTVSKDEEELLIRKRLLTQTTTARTGADPPVKKLAKKYIAWCNSVAGTKADDPEKCKEGFLRELAVYEFQLGRMTGVTRANAREVESYAAASEDVERAVTKARGDIAELKSNLDTARLERQHKEEYETLRRLCMQFPPRAETEAANAQLAEEIAALEAERWATSSKLELKKKQFALLLHVVNELQVGRKSPRRRTSSRVKLKTKLPGNATKRAKTKRYLKKSLWFLLHRLVPYAKGELEQEEKDEAATVAAEEGDDEEEEGAVPSAMDTD